VLLLQLVEEAPSQCVTYVWIGNEVSLLDDPLRYSNTNINFPFYMKYATCSDCHSLLYYNQYW